MSTSTSLALSAPASAARVHGTVLPPRAEPVKPVDTRPEVYCRQHGPEHATEGFASCAALGCDGCDPDRGAVLPAVRPNRTT